MNKQRPIIMTLSDKGYVEDTKTILARILSYYITTDASQSFSFRKALKSLPKTYYENINNPKDLGRRIAVELESQLGVYFESVEVETDVRFDETNSKADIALYASVVDMYGRKVGLGKVAEIDPSGLGNVIDVNNFGEAKRLIRR